MYTVVNRVPAKERVTLRERVVNPGLTVILVNWTDGVERMPIARQVRIGPDEEPIRYGGVNWNWIPRVVET